MRAEPRQRASWERPHMLSVQIPVVEELLAQSYRQKAEMWAEAAGISRQRREMAATDASAAATTGRSPGG